jgi:cyanophycin synthetase
VVYQEPEAVRSGLEAARPGDLLVIFGDDLGRDWEQIVGFGARPGAPPPAVRPVFAPETQPLGAVPDRRPNAPEVTEGED